MCLLRNALLCAAAVVSNSVDAFFDCTSPPLEVRFDEPIGSLACGTHLYKLNSSLANGPHITYSGADPAKGYVLMMIDPDAPSRAQPTDAPIRHWLVVNIPGAALRAGPSHPAAGSSYIYIKVRAHSSTI